MYRDLADAVKIEIANGTTYKCIIFVGENTATTTAKYITDENIVQSSFSIERSNIASNHLTYGDVVAGELKFTVDKSTLGSEFNGTSWRGVHLYPFVYPAWIDEEQITIDNVKMAQGASQIEANKRCIWCGKTTVNHKYGHIYGTTDYDGYLIPFSQYTAIDAVENKYTISISALDICSSILDTNFSAQDNPSRMLYFPNWDEDHPERPDVTGTDLFARLTQQTGITLPAKGLGYLKYPFVQEPYPTVAYAPSFIPTGKLFDIKKCTHRDLIRWMAMTAASNIIADRDYMTCTATTWGLPSDGKSTWTTENASDWIYDEDSDEVVDENYKVATNKRYSYSCNNTLYYSNKSIFHLRNFADESTFTVPSDGLPYSIGFYSNELMNQMPRERKQEDSLYAHGGSQRLINHCNSIITSQKFAHAPFRAEVLANPCFDPSDRVLIDLLGADNCDTFTPITSIIFKLNEATVIDCAFNQAPTNDSSYSSVTSQTSSNSASTAYSTIQANKRPIATNYTPSKAITSYNDYEVFLIKFAVNYQSTYVLPGKMLAFKDTDGTDTYIRGSLTKLRDNAGVLTEDKYMIALKLTNAEQETFSPTYAERHFGTNIQQLTITEIEGVI